MNNVEFTLSPVEQTVFRPDYVQSVQVRNPVQSTEGLTELHANIREQHDGVVVYPKGTLASDVGGAPNNLLYSGGWHTHGVDALNICRGSGVPSVLTYNADAARGIIASIENHRDALHALTGDMIVEFDWGFDHEIQGTVLQIFDAARIDLEQYVDTTQNDAVSDELERGSQIFRHLCHHLMIIDEESAPDSGDLVSEATLTLINTQKLVPESRRLELYPNSWDAYSIPADRAHCRSLLHGEVVRSAKTANESIFVTVD